MNKMRLNAVKKIIAMVMESLEQDSYLVMSEEPSPVASYSSHPCGAAQSQISDGCENEMQISPVLRQIIMYLSQHYFYPRGQ
jgi:hypothetical protein